MLSTRFQVDYTVTVKEDTLVTEFVVKNLNGMPSRMTILWYNLFLFPTESEAFGFTCLLHTYFRVPDISKTTISGLGGLHYVDKVRTQSAREGNEPCLPQQGNDFPGFFTH